MEERCEGSGGRRGRRQREAKELRYAGWLPLCSVAEFAGDFPMRSPLGNETKKRISFKVCDNGARKESPFAKILPKSGHEQGIACENVPSFFAPGHARAVIGPITKTSSQINSIIIAIRSIINDSKNVQRRSFRAGRR